MDDVVIRREPREGLVVAAQGQLSVALDVTITPELAVEGLAREIVSVVQGMRRTLGLEVSDRIMLTWHTENPDLAAALTEHESLIAGEVLAKRVAQGTEPQEHEFSINGRELSLALTKD